MSNRYEPFDLDAPRRVGLPFVVREASVSDALGIATVFAEREAIGALSVLEQIQAALEAGPHPVWVAEAHDDQGSTEIVGFARVRFIDAEVQAGLGATRNLRTGPYLMGLNVRQRSRRCGIGTALTKARLQWFRAHGAQHVYYIGNDNNHTTIALHANLGFIECGRDVECPGIINHGGTLVLFCSTAHTWAWCEV